MLILISPNLPFLQNPIFFFLDSCLFSYQSKSSARSNPHLFFFKFLHILISVQIFHSFKPPLFFFRFMLILISVQIFYSTKTPSFFYLNSCLFLYQSKSSVRSLFFFRFILILISVQIFRSPKTPSFFSLNSCLFLYQSKSSVRSNPLFFLLIHAYSHASPNLPFVQTPSF